VKTGIIQHIPGRRRITGSADKGQYCTGFVYRCSTLKPTAHVIRKKKGSEIDAIHLSRGIPDNPENQK
jgi:hypothetical protein